MTKLHEFLNAIGYEIHDKFIVDNSVFGDAVCEITHSNENCHLTCQFDVVTQEVFDITAEDFLGKRYYRWTAEDFKDTKQDKTTWTGAEFYELEVVEDILEKAEAMVEGWEYDARVIVPFDITDEQFAEFALAAHKLDITFNQFVERAVRAAIEKHKLQKD